MQVDSYLQSGIKSIQRGVFLLDVGDGGATGTTLDTPVTVTITDVDPSKSELRVWWTGDAPVIPSDFTSTSFALYRADDSGITWVSWELVEHYG